MSLLWFHYVIFKQNKMIFFFILSDNRVHALVGLYVFASYWNFKVLRQSLNNNERLSFQNNFSILKTKSLFVETLFCVLCCLLVVFQVFKMSSFKWMSQLSINSISSFYFNRIFYISSCQRVRRLLNFNYNFIIKS